MGKALGSKKINAKGGTIQYQFAKSIYWLLRKKFLKVT